MIKVKTFIHALNLCLTDIRKAKNFLKDKRLTHAEKTILSAYFNIRDNRNEWVIDQLSHLKSPDPVVESQRLILLGMAYNNLGNYETALPRLVASIELLKNIELPQQTFNAYHNLFIVHLNLKNAGELNGILEKLHTYATPTEIEKISLKKCQFCFHAITGDYAAAGESLHFLQKNLKNMTDAQAIGTLLDIFDFYIKQEKLDDAKSVLDQMKKYRKFHLTENYNFMKHLLMHLQSDQPLWITDDDYSKIPILFHQIKCIQKLEQSNQSEALFHWNKLKEIAPMIYLDEFQYRGDRCLFSLCLQKNIGMRGLKVDLEVQGNNKTELLINFFKKNPGPQSKEIVYELLYGKKLMDKSDAFKLHQLISRMRAHLDDTEIEYKQGCYQLKKKKVA